MEVLTLSLPEGREVLPVFGFEEEARVFGGVGASGRPTPRAYLGAVWALRERGWVALDPSRNRWLMERSIPRAS